MDPQVPGGPGVSLLDTTIREAFAGEWLGARIESGSAPGTLMLRQGSRELRVDLAVADLPDGVASRFLVSDSVADVLSGTPHPARLVVAADAPPHVVAAEFAQAATTWFGRSWRTRLADLTLGGDGGDVLSRSVPRPRRWSSLSAADYGRWAAAAVLARQAHRQAEQWTSGDETALVQRLAGMGLLAGQPHADRRRRLVPPAGWRNAHSRHLLERIWDTAVDTTEAAALSRVNLALVSLVSAMPDLKGGLARSTPDGQELRLRIPGEDGLTLVLKFADRIDQGSQRVRYDHEAHVVLIRSDASADRLLADLAGVIATVIARANGQGADEAARAAREQVSQILRDQERAAPVPALRSMLRHRRLSLHAARIQADEGIPDAQAQGQEFALRVQRALDAEDRTPLAKRTSTASQAVPDWWMYLSGRLVSGAAGAAVNLGIGALSGRATYLNAAGAAVSMVRDPTQGIVDWRYGVDQQKTAERLPGYRPDRLLEPATDNATPTDTTAVVIGHEQYRSIYLRAAVPGILTYLVKHGPPPLLGGVIGGVATAALGGAGTVAGAAFGLSAATGVGWALGDRLADRPDFTAWDLAAYVDRQSPAAKRDDALRSIYYRTVELVTRLVQTRPSGADAVLLSQQLDAARAALNGVRDDLAVEVARGLRELEWRRKPYAYRLFTKDPSGPSRSPDRPLGRAPTHQWVARNFLPSVVNAIVPITTSLIANSGLAFSGLQGLSTGLSGFLRGFGETWYADLRLKDSPVLRGFDALRMLDDSIAYLDAVLSEQTDIQVRPAFLAGSGHVGALWRQWRDDVAHGRPSDHLLWALLERKHLVQLVGRGVPSLIGFAVLSAPTAGASVAASVALSVAGALGETAFRKLAGNIGRLWKDSTARQIAAELPFAVPELGQQIAVLATMARDQQARVGPATPFVLHTSRSFWRRRLRQLARRLTDRGSSTEPALTRGPLPAGEIRLTRADRRELDKLSYAYRLREAVPGSGGRPDDPVLTTLIALGLVVVESDQADIRRAADQRWRAAYRHLTALRLLTAAEAFGLARLRDRANRPGTAEAIVVAEVAAHRPVRVRDAVWVLRRAHPAAAPQLTRAGSVLVTHGGHRVELTVREESLPDGVQARVDLKPDDLLRSVTGSRRSSGHTVAVSPPTAADPGALAAVLQAAAGTVTGRRMGRRRRVRRIVATPAVDSLSVTVPALAPIAAGSAVSPDAGAEGVLADTDVEHYLELARATQWQAASTIRERLAHRVSKVVGRRTAVDKVRDLTERIAQTGRVRPDTAAEQYPLYRLDLGDRPGLVRARPVDGAWRVRRPTPLDQALAEHDADTLLTDLVSAGWSLQFGSSNDFELLTRTLRLDPSSEAGLITVQQAHAAHRRSSPHPADVAALERWLTEQESHPVDRPRDPSPGVRSTLAAFDVMYGRPPTSRTPDGGAISPAGPSDPDWQDLVNTLGGRPGPAASPPADSQPGAGQPAEPDHDVLAALRAVPGSMAILRVNRPDAGRYVFSLVSDGRAGPTAVRVVDATVEGAFRRPDPARPSVDPWLSHLASPDTTVMMFDASGRATTVAALRSSRAQVRDHRAAVQWAPAPGAAASRGAGIRPAAAAPQALLERPPAANPAAPTDDVLGQWLASSTLDQSRDFLAEHGSQLTDEATLAKLAKTDGAATAGQLLTFPAARAILRLHGLIPDRVSDVYAYLGYLRAHGRRGAPLRTILRPGALPEPDRIHATISALSELTAAEEATSVTKSHSAFLRLLAGATSGKAVPPGAIADLVERPELRAEMVALIPPIMAKLPQHRPQLQGLRMSLASC